MPVAFHDQIWEAVSGGPLDSVSVLVALTRAAAALAAHSYFASNVPFTRPF